jgi:hypothetical protein
MDLNVIWFRTGFHFFFLNDTSRILGSQIIFINNRYFFLCRIRLIMTNLSDFRLKDQIIVLNMYNGRQ